MRRSSKLPRKVVTVAGATALIGLPLASIGGHHETPKGPLKPIATTPTTDSPTTTDSVQVTGSSTTSSEPTTTPFPHPDPSYARASRSLTTPRPTQPQPSPVSVNGRDLGSFWLTCYDLRGTTATGHPVGTDEVAVDPRVIPLGSHLLIEGVGYRYAYDTGGAVKGAHIDVWMSSCSGWPNPRREVYLA